jgi:hypothetical protein
VYEKKKSSALDGTLKGVYNWIGIYYIPQSKGCKLERPAGILTWVKKGTKEMRWMLRFWFFL